MQMPAVIAVGFFHDPKTLTAPDDMFYLYAFSPLLSVLPLLLFS
jgi:hypothetical protein